MAADILFHMTAYGATPVFQVMPANARSTLRDCLSRSLLLATPAQSLLVTTVKVLAIACTPPWIMYTGCGGSLGPDYLY
jgi:hypothetical protein